MTSTYTDDPNVETDGHINWPLIESEPISEFVTEGYIAMAFPTLFPTGDADYRAPRLKTVTAVEYFQHLMQYKDQRFARDPRFRFFALNSTMRWTALNQGTVFVRRNFSGNMPSLEQVRQMIESGDSTLAQQAMYYGANIRGTRPYWGKRLRELPDMVDTLGMPTIFFTLSAADLHWPELFNVLAEDEEWSRLDEKQKQRPCAALINENPYYADWFFSQRVSAYVTRVLTPKFDVKDYWY